MTLIILIYTPNLTGHAMLGKIRINGNQADLAGPNHSNSSYHFGLTNNKPIFLAKI